MREESEVFPCRHCGRAYELVGDGLRERVPLVAAVTSPIGRPEDARYLATWRFPAQVVILEKRTAEIEVEDVWPAIERRVAPDPAHIYVPAFTLARVAVQQLGLALVEAQPRLQLAPGIPFERPEHGRPEIAESAGCPRFGTLSPVVFDESDARAVAHFVYLALEARHTPDLRSIDYDLRLEEGELLFLPGVYDPRHARHANWRFMLVEFDGLVA